MIVRDMALAIILSLLVYMREKIPAILQLREMEQDQFIQVGMQIQRPVASVTQDFLGQTALSVRAKALMQTSSCLS